MAHTWFPIYIFLDHGYINPVLINYLYPYCNALHKQKIIKSYFFIRYNEGGQHIRIRFYATQEHIDGAIIPSFNNLFKAMQLKFPNIVQHYTYAIYEPEVGRYGGKWGMPVAETHFADSSKTVLGILQKNLPWDYAKALGYSMQLHFSFIWAIRFSSTEAKFLLQSMYIHWFESAVDFYLRNINSSIGRSEAIQTVNKSFESSYIKQKDSITSFVVSFWGDLLEKDGGSTTIRRWIKSVERIHAKYHALLKKDKLFIDAELPDKYIGDNFKLCVIYESLFHMTNNRLGILNMDEGFVGFIMLKLLDELSFPKA